MRKSIGVHGISLLLTVLLVSAAVPFASAGSTDDIKGVEAPVVPVTDDEIRDAIKGVIKEIEKSDIDPEEKKKIVDDLRTVISESPIPMDKLEKTLLNAGEALFSQEPSIGIMQAGGPVHVDMAKIAGEKIKLGSEECGELYEHADDPDGWGSYCIDHYALTGAPGEAERLANLARGQFSINNRGLGSEYLAYSMHFMTDMSVPFHYVYEALIYHTDYEMYIAYNWETGKNFLSDAQKPTYYYVITDVSDSATNLAQYSHDYLVYINNQMAHNADWENDPTLISYTRDCIQEGTKYNWGLADYVTR